MLDIKRIRQNPQELYTALKARNIETSVEDLLVLDEHRRTILKLTEEKKTLRNAAAKQLGIAKKAGSSEIEICKLTAEMKTLAEEIGELDAKLTDAEKEIENLLSSLPNYPHESVPCGSAGKSNVDVRCCGTLRTFLWEPKTCSELLADLNLVFKRNSGKKSGTEYSVYYGMGARLERAVVQFILDQCAQNEFVEVRTLNEALSPSLYSDMILDASLLPLLHSSFHLSHCISNETNNHSIEIELSKITKPQQSYKELESMVQFIENILRSLGLPCRTVLFCAGEMEFCDAKSYCIELWMPSLNRYAALCTCANCEDYLSRQLAIRYRDNAQDKPQYVHTLRCSGLSAGILMNAILETYQNEDGTVSTPAILQPYLGCELMK